MLLILTTIFLTVKADSLRRFKNTEGILFVAYDGVCSEVRIGCLIVMTIEYLRMLSTSRTG